ncbi:MAG TPA: hypothetical protein PKO41_04905, partial [Dokdonella sp.]|nr:hypothetical protein [Dokdonella sp.]
MDWQELFAIGGGLVVGYWLVRKYLEGWQPGQGAGRGEDGAWHERDAAPAASPAPRETVIIATLPVPESHMPSPVSRKDSSRTIRAPRGATLTCRSWLTEAPFRMLQNNLDAEVAENPTELVVYGGIGRAARDWACYDAIIETLKTLGDDET